MPASVRTAPPGTVQPIPQEGPQVRQVGVEGVAVGLGGLLTPHSFDDPIPRDRAPRLGEEDGQHRPLLGATQTHPGAVPIHFDRTQNPNPQPGLFHIDDQTQTSNRPQLDPGESKTIQTLPLRITRGGRNTRVRWSRRPQDPALSPRSSSRVGQVSPRAYRWHSSSVRPRVSRLSARAMSSSVSRGKRRNTTLPRLESK